ncbi:CopG family transcriptional regulator [Burkholderia multivorans]|uniref:CopG family transcriptional regulator n=1 Tax=Burkholderia multivorans TaxID=87883 RepID=UPI001590075C|nr:CopG family transcriptional regulator [Burkholderia multivorans]
MEDDHGHANVTSRMLSALAPATLRLAKQPPATRNGLPVLSNASTPRPVTLDLVNELRNETPE